MNYLIFGISKQALTAIWLFGCCCSAYALKCGNVCWFNASCICFLKNKIKIKQALFFIYINNYFCISSRFFLFSSWYLNSSSFIWRSFSCDIFLNNSSSSSFLKQKQKKKFNNLNHFKSKLIIILIVIKERERENEWNNRIFKQKKKL